MMGPSSEIKSAGTKKIIHFMEIYGINHRSEWMRLW